MNTPAMANPLNTLSARSKAASPLLLVSVRNAREAMSALQGGADIIDIKEPAQGPLGRAADATLHAIAHVVQDKAPLSIALGELVDHQAAIDLPETTAFVKIGLRGLGSALDRGPSWQERLRTCRAAYHGRQFVAVAYWDADIVNAPPADAALDWAIEHRAAALLIDTADKHQQGLLASDEDEPRLRDLLDRAHAHDLPVALAGKLTCERFTRAAALRPSVVAVRSAACHDHNRTREIDPARVADLKQQLMSFV
jgi:uncharacterized protein (UPF0264 family)